MSTHYNIEHNKNYNFNIIVRPIIDKHQSGTHARNNAYHVGLWPIGQLRNKMSSAISAEVSQNGKKNSVAKILYQPQYLTVTLKYEQKFSIFKNGRDLFHIPILPC